MYLTSQATIPSASNPVGSPETWNVTGTAANGCTATATAEINTLPLPVPAAAVEPGNRVCLGEVAVFKGSGAFAYEWKGPGNYTFSGASVSLAANNPALAGTYSLTAFDRYGCKGKAQVSLAISDLPQGYLTSSSWQGCVPLCANFNYVPLNENAPPVVSQNWSINKTPVTSSEPNRFSMCFSIPGNHLVMGQLTAGNGCVNTVTYMVKALPQPVANFTFSPENPVENTEPVNFYSTSSGADLNKFNWFFIDNSGFKASEKNTSYLFENAGTYPIVLRIEDENGCADTIIKTITVSPDFIFFVPNAFTPNDDGKNEIFTPVSRGIKLYEFMVFDRWGAVVFKTNSTDKGWDGTLNGNACPADSYVWKANISTLNGEMKLFTGTVVLIR
jgi:gliding motility-associated-like protein